MQKYILKVPKVRYIGQWKDFLLHLPSSGQFLLNKVYPDCGATFEFLTNDIPIILAAPRKPMLESKKKQHLNAFYYEADTSPHKLEEYILNMRTARQPQKILVTYDSLYKVLAVVGKDIDRYLVVVDEMQCLIGDASFKGDKVLEVVGTLQNVPNVMYLSATVYEDSFLDNIPMFAHLPYY